MELIDGRLHGMPASGLVIERVEVDKKRYLDSGDMYVILADGAAVAECLVTDEGEGLLELKSLAVAPRYQGRGLGRLLIETMVERYRGSHSIMQVGTGDVPSTVGFYERCGFTRSHVIENFFTDNYDHAIFEDGVQLVDMVCLRRPMRSLWDGDAESRSSGLGILMR